MSHRNDLFAQERQVRLALRVEADTRTLSRTKLLLAGFIPLAAGLLYAVQWFFVSA